MFSPEKKIFALCFAIVFIIVISYQYYKDKKKNKAMFKNTYWVLLAVIVTMIGYTLLNKFLH